MPPWGKKKGDGGDEKAKKSASTKSKKSNKEAQDDPPDEELLKALTAFYTKHNPSQVASVPRREATTPEPLVAFSSEVPLHETAGVVSRKRERRGPMLRLSVV